MSDPIEQLPLSTIAPESRVQVVNDHVRVIDAAKIPKFFKTLFPAWFKDQPVSTSGGDIPRGEVLFKNDRDIWEFYRVMTETSKAKQDRVTDYEMMINDPTNLAAVEMVAEDSFQTDELNRSLSITASGKIKAITQEFFDKFDIENRIESWAFFNAFYGEVPILIDGQDDDGITFIDDNIHPLDFYRIQSGSLFGFMSPYRADERGKMQIIPPWGMIHTYYKRSFYKTRREKMIEIKIGGKNIILDAFDVIGFLEPVRSLYKKIRLVDDSLVLARLDRAPKKRVFYIDVGDADPAQKIQIINEFKRNYKSEVGFTVDGYYKSQLNPLTFGQELFIPISEGIKNVEVNEYGGDTEVAAIADIDYLRKKYYSGLKIPPAFLNDTEDLPGSLGESALVRLEIRYARTVKANRRGVMSGIFRLAQINAAYRGFDVTRKDLEISANYISTAEEEEMRSIFKNRVEVTDQFMDILGKLGYDINKDSMPKMVSYVLYDMLKLVTFDTKILEETLKSDEGVKKEFEAFVAENLKERVGDEVYETPLTRDKWTQRFNKAFGERANDAKVDNPRAARKEG